MADLIKTIDETSGLCEKAVSTENAEYFLKNGYKWGDCEEGFDGRLYVSGMAPEKPVDLKKQEVRRVRNKLLKESDKYALLDFPQNDAEREEHFSYRQYLRDWTAREDWFEYNPMTFEEWIGEK